MFRKKFPIFQNNPNMVYLDSAASAQKLAVVVDKMKQLYEQAYANIHRGVCGLAENITKEYEKSREVMADFISAKAASEIIFTKGATESINLVANGVAHLLQPGDEVLVSEAEHHANFVPWQQLCLKTGAVFKVFKVTAAGTFDMDHYQQMLSDRTKIVAITHQSNVLGVVNPVTDCVQLAHQKGALVLVDGAQSVAHMPIDVVQMACDYFVFSGHKLYGPTGVGVLYGTRRSLELLSPYQYGGDMVKEVTAEKTTFADIPARFEAGTPPFVEAIALSTVPAFLKENWQTIQVAESELTAYLVAQLQQIELVDFLGDPQLKKGIVSFNIKGVHPADIAFVLSKKNVCVRVGHHCAMPLHHAFSCNGSLRVSLGVYNNQKEIDLFIEALIESIQFFRGQND